MKILEGIKNLAFKQQDIENLAKHRKEICKTCIWYSENQKGKDYEDLPDIIKKLKTKEWMEDVTSDGEKCINCGCGLGQHSIKLRCTSCSCPINKWRATTSLEEQIEVEKIIENGQ